MIRFVCKCGQTLEEPDHRAGSQLQCPNCMCLLDVPTGDEMVSLESDGTVMLADAEPTPSSLDQKLRIYGHQDDLRPDLEEFYRIDTVRPADAPPSRLPPRYDPETGELIKPMGLDGDSQQVSAVAKRVIPVGAPTLGYARTVADPKRPIIPFWRMPAQLIYGSSLAAMFFVFLAHLLAHLFLVIPAANFLLFPVTLFIGVAIATHYCNTIEEFGPRERDSVPVMLRNVSFSEDILQPFYALMWATLFAFTPMILALMLGLSSVMKQQPLILAAISGWGLLVFPAVLFTSVTSGAMENLVPHRAFSVVAVAFWKYAMAWLAFFGGVICYAAVFAGVVFTSIDALTSFGAINWGRIAVSTLILYALMLAAVYLMHLSAAWLGLIYRAHYEQFNWIYQKHQKVHRTDTLAQLQEMRREGRTIDPARLAEIRQAEAVRRAAHEESMRKL